MSYLSIRKVSATYGTNTILDSIDLDVGQGEMHVLLGPSGCGKTTLLRSIAGLVQPSGGEIHLANRRIDQLVPKERGIAMVFQNYALFPNMTVRQNLAFGLEQKKLPKAEIASKVDAALDMVALSQRADVRPHQLSGGQRQRVALARALILDPGLLLLDEPLSALDAQIRKKLRDELKRIQRDTGLTSILVTHDQDEALSLGDRISVMNAGVIAQTGTPREIYHRPQSLFVAGFIGDVNVLQPQDMQQLTGENASSAIVIQPHTIALHAATDGSPASDSAIRIPAMVLDASLTGASIRYTVLARDVRLKIERHDRYEAEVYPRGSDVMLTINRQDMLSLPAGA